MSTGQRSCWFRTAGSTTVDWSCSRTLAWALTGTYKCLHALRLEGIKGSSTGVLFHVCLPALTHLISRRVYFLINVFRVSFLTWKTFSYFFLAGHLKKRFTDLFHILLEISLKFSLVSRLGILVQDHRLRKAHSNWVWAQLYVAYNNDGLSPT